MSERPAFKPTRSGERVALIDALRGLAILGILLVNMSGYSGTTLDPSAIADSIDRSVAALIHLLVVAKFYSLFSFLFGWGMAIQRERAVARGARFVPHALRRNLILLGIGVLHGVFLWSGDILALYALLGIVLLLLRDRSDRFLIAVVLLALTFTIALGWPGEEMQSVRSRLDSLTAFLRFGQASPERYATGSYLEVTELRLQEFLATFSLAVYYVGNVFAMFALGYLAGRGRWFRSLGRQPARLRKVFWGALASGLVLNALYLAFTLRPVLAPDGFESVSRLSARVFGAPLLALAYAFGLQILFRRESWRPGLLPLTAVGRMALTNYLLQSLLATILFYGYGLGLYGEISPTVGIALAFLIFALQVRLSEWWMARHPFGPMEWLWRALTYGRRPPWRVGETYADVRLPRLVRRLRRYYARSNPWLVLGAVWLVLAVWGTGLVYWSRGLRQPGFDAPVEVVVRVTATPPAEAPDPVQDDEPARPGAPLPAISIGRQDTATALTSPDSVALAREFDPERALAHIRTLAGSAFAGRFPATPGGRAAGDYIAEQFRRYGLEPGGVEGTYFQPFFVDYTQLTGVPQLSVTGPGGSSQGGYVLFQDYSPVAHGYTGGGFGEGPVVWADGCRDEDLADLDVVDKVLLCRYLPTRAAAQLSGRNALAYGAAGLLFATDPAERPVDFGDIYRAPWVPDTVPALRVYPSVVADLLAGTGHTFESLLAHGEPLSLDARVRLEVPTEGDLTCPAAGCEARNVLGVLPGRDPAYAHQVVLLGAHYDHLGQGPDGTIWAGANDNASGVAALLEIARTWQEAGYRPRRTVVFAAWDAEEMGLLGSSYYVRNPPFPLADTLAAIQMDMVGAGADTLLIDGEAALAGHLENLAGSSDVPVELYNLGRSDHVPFLEAGVPASLLIWFSEESGPAHYHRPVDKPEVIDPGKLEAAAELAELAVLDLAESAPAIESLIARRAAAAAAGDEAALLATSSPKQHPVDRRWLQSLRARDPISVTLSPQIVRVRGDVAFADVWMEIIYAPEDGEEGTQIDDAWLEVQFALTESGWVWDGPEVVFPPLSESAASAPEGIAFSVGYPPDLAPPVDWMTPYAARQYAEMARLLGLPTEVDAEWVLLPDREALRMSTDLNLPPERVSWVAPGVVRLVHEEPITGTETLSSALAHLLLVETGVTETASPWLWSGLPGVLRAREDAQPVQVAYVPELAEGLSQGEASGSGAETWAAVSYLQEEIGWRGLGALIADLGARCESTGCPGEDDWSGELQEALGMDASGFEAAWRAAWRSRLNAAQAGIDSVLMARQAAVRSLDEEAFLATVDPGDDRLLATQRAWFASVQENPPEAFELTGRPLAWYPNGDLLAEVTMSYQNPGADGPPARSVQYRARIAVGEGSYRWAGTPFESVQNDLVTVRYPAGKEELAGAFLEATTESTRYLANTLGVDPPRLTLDLYGEEGTYQADISIDHPSSDQASAWVIPGAGVKLLLSRGERFEPYLPALTNRIARFVLAEMGVTSEWLLKGVSDVLARALDGGVAAKTMAETLPEVPAALRATEGPALRDMPEDHQVSWDEHWIRRTQAWDSVRFLISRFGWETLMGVLEAHSQGASLDSALSASIDMDLDGFEDVWTASLYRGHVDEEWLRMVDSFDADEAYRHVQVLSDSTLEGREAGTQGAHTAAAYIADRFEQVGLEPVGDPFGASYFQAFPVTQTRFLLPPQFVLLDQAGRTRTAFSFREEFSPVAVVTGTGAPVEGELIWVNEEEAEHADLTGMIWLTNAAPDPEVTTRKIEWAESRGAAGVILMGWEQDPEVLLAKQPLATSTMRAAALPVIELSSRGKRVLLEALGTGLEELEDLPAVQPLGARVRLALVVDSPRRVPTANVLGLLPGADPYLSREVVVVGAHYDHVGDDPDLVVCAAESRPLAPRSGCEVLPGRSYPGENDNASGVALVLEILRLWEAEGYRPARSVLFAAWGAQELGQKGSTYFLEHPTVSLSSIGASLNVDGVGSGQGFNPGVEGVWSRDGLPLYALKVAEDLLGEKLTVTEPVLEGDHLPFQSARIPAVRVSWRLPRERNWPDEIALSVRPERLTVTGRLVALALMQLGG